MLDEHTHLRDSHDLGESLQYVLESVPNGRLTSSNLDLCICRLLIDLTVDRAFVHHGLRRL